MRPGVVLVTAKAVGTALPKVGTAKMLMLNFPRSGWDRESGCLLKYVICVKRILAGPGYMGRERNQVPNERKGAFQASPTSLLGRPFAVEVDNFL